MTRTTTTKLVATALAVASLGLATTAQAEEMPEDPATTPDTAAQTQNQAPLGETPDQGANAAAAAQEEEIDYSSPEYFKSDEAKERFKRYCNMKDAEPSHSDKKFCEDFRRHNGTGTTTSSTGDHWRPEYCKYPTFRYDPRCDHKPHPKPHPRPYPEPEKPHYEENKPVYKKAEEPNKETLPFTGLEIWQLGLIGIVLVGGGIGARRLLVS